MAILNSQLAKKQRISEEQRESLYKLYEYMDELLKQASEDKNLEKTGKSYSDRMATLEFSLQKNWNFPEDKLKHTWWNRFKGCTCPVMDNDERFGFEKIITCDCPFHKHLCKESKVKQ